MSSNPIYRKFKITRSSYLHVFFHPLQQGRLDSIASDISRLQKAQQESWAKQVDSKRKQVDFFSRVLRIISWIEGERKRGYTIQVKLLLCSVVGHGAIYSFYIFALMIKQNA